MEQIIKAIEQATSLPVRPLFSDTIEDCVTYKIVPHSDNGAVAVTQLELRIITKTLAASQTAKSAILSALVTVGDQSKLGYNQCYLNGGGQIYDYDTKTIHTILYLYITQKSEVSYNG